MRNFKQQKKWRDVMQSKPVLIFLGLVILVFAWNTLGFFNKMLETSKNKKVAEENLASLEVQKEKLTSDINDLNTDKGKEKVFRENFGEAKVGEQEIVVLDDKTSAEAPKKESSGFFTSLMFWKNWFK